MSSFSWAAYTPGTMGALWNGEEKGNVDKQPKLSTMVVLYWVSESPCVAHAGFSVSSQMSIFSGEPPHLPGHPQGGPAPHTCHPTALWSDWCCSLVLWI